MSNEEQIVLKGDLIKIGSVAFSILCATYYLGGKIENVLTTLKSNTENITKVSLTVEEHTKLISISKQDIRELQLYRELSSASGNKLK